jgi:hypothetical protein
VPPSLRLGRRWLTHSMPGQAWLTACDTPTSITVFLRTSATTHATPYAGLRSNVSSREKCVAHYGASSGDTFGVC